MTECREKWYCVCVHLGIGIIYSKIKSHKEGHRDTEQAAKIQKPVNEEKAWNNKNLWKCCKPGNIILSSTFSAASECHFPSLQSD